MSLDILIVGNAMDNFTGQPMSTYENAKELSKEHNVSVLVLPSRWSNNELKSGLEYCGVKCIYEAEPKYDLILASEWMPNNVEGYKINIVRSEYDCETPIPNCDHYVCIRPSIQDHIIKEHNISSELTSVIYNGVDMNRFHPMRMTKRDYEKIISPCTIDPLREKFLNHIIGTLNEKKRLFIYGSNYGAKLIESKYVTILPPTFNIDNVMADSDLVVGILLGRVNLEARACGVASIMYDPITLKETVFNISDKEFNNRHNIIYVMRNLLKVYYRGISNLNFKSSINK